MRVLLTALLVVAVSLVPAALGAEDAAAKPIRALLVIGGCCHDYARQKDILARGISARANVQVTVAYDPDTSTRHLNPVYDNPDWAKGFDVVIHDECSSDVKDLVAIDRILKPHREGLPAVVLHCGMHSYRSAGWPNAVTPWFAFTGLPSTGHGPEQPIAITFTDRDSPIVKGLQDWTTVNEELYNNSAGKVLETAHLLARGKQGASDYVVAWTNTYKGKTRVFGTTLGHNNATVADGRYLDLVTRGLLWATGHLTEDGKPAPGYEAKK
jgi:type 1 glutamine amidotransferase